MVKTRIHNHKRVFTWFASRRPQTPAEASLEASLEIQRPQGAGRPCYEADNSACRGEWRREAGSPARARLMSAWERESGELPAPNLPPSGRKAGRGLFVFLEGVFSLEILDGPMTARWLQPRAPKSRVARSDRQMSKRSHL